MRKLSRKDLGKKVKVPLYNRDLSFQFITGEIIAIDPESELFMVSCVIQLGDGAGLTLHQIHTLVRRFYTVVFDYDRYIGKEYCWLSSSDSNFEFLVKYYPNTNVFKKLYPQGKEEDGFWVVE